MHGPRMIRLKMTPMENPMIPIATVEIPIIIIQVGYVYNPFEPLLDDTGHIGKVVL